MGEGSVLAVTRAGTDGPRRLHMLAADSLAELWSAPSLNGAAAFSGDDVFGVDRETGKDTLVAREAQTGEVRWRSEPIPREILVIHTGGPLVFCTYDFGVFIFNRADGGLLGDVKCALSPPAVARGSLYMTGESEVFCASLDRYAGT